uniref:Uncharacterized protein n=1 Tax=Oryza sativa subsp. japonica TaxID=39947 RepID=Q2QQ66_ORYSJ|nr:hypothetical protein LOC_Os12g32069 [Oryza sativa Japonica Group]
MVQRRPAKESAVPVKLVMRFEASTSGRSSCCVRLSKYPMVRNDGLPN